MSSQREYGVVTCDIDQFKRCNDRYGHQLGDDILRRVAETIRALLRSGDAAFRFGGEEVILLLPKRGLEGATAAAERIRREIERQTFGIESVAEPISVTISFGVATIGLREVEWPLRVGFDALRSLR
jgi:diguanylate cyclase (GGDEF)-like protein